MEEEEEQGSGGVYHTGKASSALPPLHPKKNTHRRRGKGKGKGLVNNNNSASATARPPAPPPPLPATALPPTKKKPDPYTGGGGWVSSRFLESDIWEDEVFKSYVDAADPKAMELLIRDLAQALPGISEQIVERKQSDLGFPPKPLNIFDNSPDFRAIAPSWASPDRHRTWANRDRATSLDVLTAAVASAVVDDEHLLSLLPLPPALSSTPSITLQMSPSPTLRLPSPSSSSSPTDINTNAPIWSEYDPDRAVRVAWVVEMAENERVRRQEEMEEMTRKDRLLIAARIEWAVMASEAFRLKQEQEQERRERDARLARVLLEEETERARRIEATLPDEVNITATDYEVICPYNSLGCDVTLKRSELPAHFAVCVHRAEIQEANRLAQYYAAYNPLDHIVVCPYTVVGCDHSCRRADLPAHLANCPLRVETMSSSTHPYDDEYEVVCPYSTKGCAHICDLAELPKHLLHTCKFGPSTRDEEEAERETNRAAAIVAEEEERSRRMTFPRERVGSKDLQSRNQILNQIASTKNVGLSSWNRERNIKVQWVKQAAEIEKMRRAEERLAMESRQNWQDGMGGEEDSLPPGRRQVVLEMALRRQKLHHANWFPSQTLALEGRRTHVAPFHNHLEQQTRVLHRMLHDEIERFGRDCAIWELETRDVVSEMIDNIRIVVESCWQKYVSTSMPTLHIFGSFASELSVPGVSDLDLVVVPGPEELKPMSTKGNDVRQLMKDRLEAARRCTIIGEALSNCPDFLENVRVIDTASVPLVTMRTINAAMTQSGPGLDIDLTVALSQHDGVQAAELVKLLRVRFPPLMPMVRLLKAFLFARGLANPFLGGLSSYALVLMAACSVMRSFDRAGKAIFLNQGELIVDFLDLFGREFDCRQDAVICSRDPADKERMGLRRGGRHRFLRIAPRNESSSSDIEHVMLVVDDPIRVGNNIGRPCFAFPKVQAAFAEALASLLSFVVKNEALSSRGGGQTTMLEKIFGVRPMSLCSEE